jgi:dolichol-phosphate mannosyltransferase
MSTFVVVPTYNERENIEKLIPKVLSLSPELEILVVDDASPDGTGEYVETLSENDPRIHVIHREGKLGLGSAYVKGFKEVVKMGAERVVQMDADFSHDPEMITDMLAELDGYDVVIGSRYLKGANVVNWPLSRLFLSYFANVYARVVTGLPLCDSTGGFKSFKSHVLSSIDLDRIHSDGYSFQIEVNFRCWRKGFRIKEIPIVFVDRHAGTSKMSRRIVWEAVWVVWRLGFERFLRRT